MLHQRFVPKNSCKKQKAELFALVEVDGLDVRRHPFRSLIIGSEGPYVPFPSHSVLTYLGPQVSMLLLDCRFVSCLSCAITSVLRTDLIVQSGEKEGSGLQ